MPSSRAERERIGRTRRLPCWAATALALALALPAAAEVGKPVRLLPTPSAPAAEPPAAAAPPAEDIRTAPLAPVDGAWAGSLTEADGGFPATLWRGTQRGVVAAILPLVGPTTSPTLQGLAHRLLLSDGAPPEGPDAADRPSLAALRLERMAALGEIEGAESFLLRLPRAAQGEAADRLAVELRFAANDPDAGCRLAQERIARYQTPWWDRALIACEALAGEHERAALGLALTHEQKAPRDQSFDALVESLAGQKRKLDKLPDPSPVKLALLAAAKQPLPADALGKADPLMLREWATNEAIPASQRLAAGERAAALGVLPPAGLAALYAKIDAKPEEQAAALKDGKPPEDARARALLYLAALNGQTPQTRAAALAALLAEARTRGGFAVTARVVAPILADLPPAKEPEGLAADAARALLVAGRADTASAWIAASDATELLAVRRLARRDGEATTAALLKDAVAALVERDSATAQRRGELLFALFAALDEPLAGVDWAPLVAPPHDAPIPGALLWAEQQQAAKEKRLGATVLATLPLASSGERLSAEPVVLGRAVAGLKAVGLEAEARALAVEAAVAAGI